MSLYLKYISCRSKKLGLVFFFFQIESDSFCPLIGTCRPFAFNVIINMIRFKSFFSLFVSSVLCSFCPSFLPFELTKYFLRFSFYLICWLINYNSVLLFQWLFLDSQYTSLSYHSPFSNVIQPLYELQNLLIVYFHLSLSNLCAIIGMHFTFTYVTLFLFLVNHQSPFKKI